MPEVYEATRYRPCVVLAHADEAYRADAGRRLRRLGWDVYLACAGAEARRLARMLRPEVVVLGLDLADETGWLTCAKLTQERPGGKVVLVGEGGPRNREQARFVGACDLVPREDSLAAIVARTCAPPAAAAG